MAPTAKALAGFLAGLLSAGFASSQKPPSPREFLGHEVGADHFLADYGQLVAYWRELAARSDRLVLEDIGPTSYGQTMWMAIVSSPANLERREHYRRIAERLCRARDEDPAVVAALAEEGRAIVWIDAGMHATEAVAAQNILELVWRMVSRDDPEVRRILENVILLVCPANPDGMEMIAKAYMATRRVGGIPVLYQRYVGHDNNRDFYACNQIETTNINRVLYRRWYPQIVYNHHQSAPRGTIIFTPPFRDPFNYNVDPLVIRGIELVAAHMNHRFATEGKAGVISRSGAPYSTWWNGGLRTTAYFHNMIGILTESFGRPGPTRVVQTLDLRLPYGDYPMPVGTQVWHARQTIEYLQTANFAVLDFAARYSRELLQNIWKMGRNAIRAGSEDHWTVTPRLVELAREWREQARRKAAEAADGGEAAEGGVDAGRAPDPFTDPALRDARVYVLPRDRGDRGAAVRLVAALIKNGVEVHRAVEPLHAAGRTYPAGSFVVRAAQAFRAHVRDMFEPQWYPEDRGSKGDPVRPYDAAGWTLAMQMDVTFDRLFEEVQGRLELLEEPPRRAPGAFVESRRGWVLDRRDVDAYRAANRLLAAGERLLAAPGDPKIYVLAGQGTATRVRKVVEDTGVSARELTSRPRRARALRRARIGLFDVYGGDIATGWTQWVLEHYEFPVRRVFGRRIAEGDLRRDFDVLMFQTGLPAPGGREPVGRASRRRRQPLTNEQVRAIVRALPPFEDWSTVEDRRVRLEKDRVFVVLRRFVEEGGVLLAFGRQATAVAAGLDLPVEEGIWIEKEGRRRRAGPADFYVPGSLVGMEVYDRGAPRQLAVMFRRSPVFSLREGAPGMDRVDVLARYARRDVLRSGSAVGEQHLAGRPAILEVRMGRGRVVLHGPDVLYRGQPIGTFKLVFDQLLR